LSFFNESDEAESNSGVGYEELVPKRRRIAWRQIIGYSLTLIFLGGVAYAFNAPTPYVIEEPGTVFNVLGDSNGGKVITISGATTYETAPADTAGKLFLLTVRLRGQPGHTPSWVEVFQAWADPKMNVLPIDAVFAPGVSSTQSTAEDFAMMKDSQQQATAAALRQLGYKIPNRVTVYSVTKNTPADGLLKANDVITAVDGALLSNGDTLRTLVKNNADKKPLDLTISRGAETLHEQVTPVQIKGNWRMGISIVDTYDFPFSVKLRLQNVGGPSGGMMFALGIIDKLTPGSLTGGLAVAGTGEIDGNGNVYPIGGIQQKMWGALGKGATWFLAPADNCDEVVGHIPDGLHVTKVSTLQDSLNALKAIAANPKTTALPQCTATK
jgi:PDZ domain-containing protein